MGSQRPAANQMPQFLSINIFPFGNRKWSSTQNTSRSTISNPYKQANWSTAATDLTKMGIWDTITDLVEAATPWTTAEAEAPPAEDKVRLHPTRISNSSRPRHERSRRWIQWQGVHSAELYRASDGCVVY
jgi:hypothetical protein